MSYKTIPIVKTDAKTVHILTGAIISTGNGVAEVNIDGYGVYSNVPVFYHCEVDSETADGMPFRKNDRVIIVNSGSAETLSIANMRVVGFEDGLPRKCCSLYEMFNDPALSLWEITNLRPAAWNYSVENGHLSVSGQSLQEGQGTSLTFKNTDVYGVTKDTDLSVSISGSCYAYCLESGKQAIYTYARGYVQFKIADEADEEATTRTFYFLLGECDLARNSTSWYGIGNHIFNLSEIIPEGWHMQEIRIVFTLSHGITDEESWINASVDFITVCPEKTL